MGDLTSEKLLLFVLMALPGAIAIRVYSLWCPTSQRDWKESLTDAIIYSVFGLALWLMFFPSLIFSFVTTAFTPPSEGESREGLAAAFYEHRFLLFGYAVATPVLLASVWYFLRLHVLHRAFSIDHPKRTAWDWVFSRRRPFYLLVYLKTKNSSGIQFVKAGYFGGNSYVTSYPHDPEIFFERVHELTPEGEFGKPTDDTDGMLIRMSEIDHMEFFIDRATTERPLWYVLCCKAVFVQMPLAIWRNGLRYAVIIVPKLVCRGAYRLVPTRKNTDGRW